MNYRPTNIPNLTPLRGMAAVLVAAYHFNEVAARFVDPQHTMLIGKCYLMVDLFFIMSGFIMLHVYGYTFAESIGKRDFWKFIGARFARIYPLHLFTLLALVALFYGLHEPSSPINNPRAIPTHLLLLQSFWIHDIFTWNVPAWSISAEWWAYMIFPLLVVLLAKYKLRAIAGLSALSILLYIAIAYWLPRVNPFAPGVPVPHDLNVTYDYGWVRGIAGFVAGMILYTAYRNQAIFNFFKRDIISILMIVLATVIFHFGVNDLVIAACFMPLILAVATNENLIARLFRLRLPQYFGDISYSIYLTHIFALFYFAVPLNAKLGFVASGQGAIPVSFVTGLGLCALYLLAVVLISSVTYYLIERPCRNWLNAKFKHKSSVAKVQLVGQ